MTTPVPERQLSAEPSHEPIAVLAVTVWGDRAEAAMFIGLQRRGCRVRVCCRPDSPCRAQLEAAGVEVVPIACRKRIDFAAISAIRAELRAARYDVLHLLHNRAVSNGLLAVRAFPAVKVVVYRGVVGNVSFLSPSSWLRYLNPRVDRIVCVAEAIRRDLLGLGFAGWRLPPEKLVTIHKGHDLAWYAAPPVDLGRFDIPEGAFAVGCVANARPRKGIEVLVRAFGRLPAEAPIYLVLAGRMASPRLDALIAASPNAARIRKLGYRTDAPALIGACQAAVLPSLAREGLPRSIIEAMAYAVAPIVTDVGGSPELVADGESGLVVPPGDEQALAEAILRLYREPELRERLGAAARHRIETEFHTDRTVERTLALYRELLVSERAR